MGLLDKIKTKVLKDWIRDVLSPVDTEEKRNIAMNNEVKKGMNNYLAWVLAVVGGAVIQAVQEAADGGSLTMIFHDPGKLFAAVQSITDHFRYLVGFIPNSRGTRPKIIVHWLDFRTLVQEFNYFRHT